MLLSDKDIKQALKDKKIIIKPKPNLNKALTACSIDLRLNHEFEVFEHSRIPFFDPKHANIETLTEIKRRKRLVVSDLREEIKACKIEQIRAQQQPDSEETLKLLRARELELKTQLDKEWLTVKRIIAEIKILQDKNRTCKFNMRELKGSFLVKRRFKTL